MKRNTPTCSLYFSSFEMNEIRRLMYSFGDAISVGDVDDEAVECMCSMVQIYLEQKIKKACDIANIKGSFDKECYLFLEKSDLGKFKRLKELSLRNEAVKKELYMDL